MISTLLGIKKKHNVWSSWDKSYFMEVSKVIHSHHHEVKYDTILGLIMWGSTWRSVGRDKNCLLLSTLFLTQYYRQQDTLQHYGEVQHIRPGLLLPNLVHFWRQENRVLGKKANVKTNRTRVDWSQTQQISSWAKTLFSRRLFNFSGLLTAMLLIINQEKISNVLKGCNFLFITFVKS